jgi:hypothetical protein
MEKKIGELQENEKKVMLEVEELKTERDRKMMETQRMIEKEREMYKGRLAEME